MRIKLIGDIIEKTKLNKTNYAHEISSMILNNLSPQLSNQLHKKEKFYRTVTFTNTYITNNQMVLYIAGEEYIIEDFIANLQNNNIIRIDDMVIVINKINLLNQLQKSLNNTYLFKSKVIINIFNKEANKTELANVMVTQERLLINSINKCEQLGVKRNIQSIKLINPNLCRTKYKNGTIYSYKTNVQVIGDYEMVNTIFNIGMGENTFSGHGFLWEVK